jgi:hypothetical protein
MLPPGKNGEIILAKRRELDLHHCVTTGNKRFLIMKTETDRFGMIV